MLAEHVAQVHFLGFKIHKLIFLLNIVLTKKFIYRARTKSMKDMPVKLPRSWKDLISAGIPKKFHTLANGSPFLRCVYIDNIFSS